MYSTKYGCEGKATRKNIGPKAYQVNLDTAGGAQHRKGGVEVSCSKKMHVVLTGMILKKLKKVVVCRQMC